MIDPIQRNLAPQMEQPEAHIAGYPFALNAIKILGALFIVGGIGCLLVVSQIVPAIALLTAGVAALVLGFALQKSESLISFGAEEWMNCVHADPGAIPPLPDNIGEILAQPCRFWPDKTVAETHTLMLIPKTVTAVIDQIRQQLPLTLTNLGKLVKASERSGGVSYREGFEFGVFEQFGEEAPRESYWILMTNNFVPGSKGKTYEEQKHLLEEAGYEVPGALEAATVLFLENLRTGVKPFAESGLSPYTRCKEGTPFKRLRVGGFMKNGLHVSDCADRDSRPYYGIAGVRKLH